MNRLEIAKMKPLYKNKEDYFHCSTNDDFFLKEKRKDKREKDDKK